MKLLQGFLRPGIVVETLYGGCIKATAPGLFSNDSDPDDLPPIMPWFIGSNTNGFSQPKICDEVWILNFGDNPLQLYWFKKEDYDNTVLSVPDMGQNVEILCNRNVNGEWCGIYFTDGTGWIINKGNSKIVISNNGDIALMKPAKSRCIEINNNNISIGSSGQSAHSAAYGDIIEKILTDLCLMLNGIATKALTNPHTAAIGTDLLQKLPSIVNQISDVSSTNVTID